MDGHGKDFTWLSIGLALLLVGSGCDGSNRVSGAVSYDGKPVEKGQIIFLPKDGQGPIVGAPIFDGKYKVANLPPGSKTVQISSNKRTGPVVRNLDEIAKKGDPGDNTTDIEPDPLAIPADAVGNQTSIEIRGSQTNLDFHLKKPGS